MEPADIDMLIQFGEIRANLAERLSHEVLTAYNHTFGDVQRLSVEHDMLGAICKKLKRADHEKRVKFWDYLNSPQPSLSHPLNDCKEPLPKRLWKNIAKWVEGLRPMLFQK